MVGLSEVHLPPAVSSRPPPVPLGGLFLSQCDTGLPRKWGVVRCRVSIGVASGGPGGGCFVRRGSSFRFRSKRFSR